MTGLELREVTGDSAVLAEIYRLRVTAWATEDPAFAVKFTEWCDDWDNVSRHWAIMDKATPIAASRLSIHAAVDQIPNYEIYREVLSSSLPSPIGSLNRLVVHPSFRRRGLSHQLDTIRLKAASESHCKCVVVNAFQGPERISSLLALGFEVIGDPVLPDLPFRVGTPVVVLRRWLE